MGKYEINWIKEPTDRKDWFWVERIFCKLGHYYDDYIEDVAEMPFNYTERSILGSLAIAADKCGYYTLLDYSTKVQNGYRYPDLWITLEPIVKRHNVVLEAKRLEKYSFKTNEFKESVPKKIEFIHKKILDKHKIGKNEKAKFQCALLAYQFRIDKNKWGASNNNSYDEKWDKLQNDQEKRKGDNTEWVDEKSRCSCSFQYLYWVPFNKIKDIIKQCKEYYPKTQKERPQYLKPAWGLLIIGSFREIKSGVRR
jgi:hypothetical protein